MLTHNNYNMGSIAGLQYCKPENIISTPLAYQGRYINDFTVTDPADWVDLTPYIIRAEGGIDCQPVVKDGAKGFEVTVTISFPSLIEQNSDIANRLERKDCVYKVKDNNGNYWFVGTKENPAVLTYSAGTGQTPDDKNQYSIIIKHWSRQLPNCLRPV